MKIRLIHIEQVIILNKNSHHGIYLFVENKISSYMSQHGKKEQLSEFVFFSSLFLDRYGVFYFKFLPLKVFTR